MDLGRPFLLRKLILKEWIKAFFISIIILLLLFSVGDLISGFLRRKVTASEVFINYFLSFPWVFSKIIPFSCLLATLFSLNKLRNRSELVAILASGFPRRQIVSSILQITAVVVTFQLINAGYIDPFFKRLHKDMIVDGDRKFSQAKLKSLLISVIGGGKIWYRSDDHYVSYSIYRKSTKTLVNPTFYYFDDQNNNIKIIRSDEATGYENGYWILSNAQIISKISDPYVFPEMNERKELKLFLPEAPSDFARIDNDLKTLSPMALYQFVSQIRRSGLSSNEYEVFLLEKVMSGLMCFIFALIPIGIIFSPNQRGPSFGKNVVFAIVFLISFLALHGFFVSLGNTGKMEPFLAVFMASIICLVYFLYLFRARSRL